MYTEIHDAIRYLSSLCDGARQLDGQGFNKIDAGFGHSLARERSLTHKQAKAGYFLVRRYKNQLVSAGRTMPKPPEAAETVVSNGKGRGNMSLAVHENLGLVALKTPYNPSTIQRAKKANAKWRTSIKSWVWDINQAWEAAQAFPDAEQSDAFTILIARQAKGIAPEKLKEQHEIATILEPAGKAVEHDPLQVELPDGRKLYEHQIEGAEFLARRQGALLGDVMGLGKTLVALTAAKAVADKHHCHIFVVAPASLQDNWRREADGAGIDISVYSWANLPADKKWYTDNGQKKVRYTPRYTTDANGKMTSSKGPTIPRCNYVLIVDEAHYAQNNGAARTRCMVSLALNDRCKAAWMLTGTPLRNGRPVALWPLLQAIRHPLAVKMTYVDYTARYCGRQKTRWGVDVNGATNLDELNEELEPYFLRRRKEDALDLPSKTRTFLAAEVSPQDRKAHKAMIQRAVDNFNKRCEEAKIEAAARGMIPKRMENAAALVALGAMRKAGSYAKIESAIKLATTILGSAGLEEEQPSVVMFTEYIDTARILAKHFAPLGVSMLLGETTVDKRQQLVDDFQAGRHRVFIATTGAGGVGITLTRAQYVILVDRPWTPGDVEQAEDRLHRIGQKSSVTSYWVEYGEFDMEVRELLATKEANIQPVLAKRLGLRAR